jgi:hypothetical protein
MSADARALLMQRLAGESLPAPPPLPGTAGASAALTPPQQVAYCVLLVGDWFTENRIQWFLHSHAVVWQILHALLCQLQEHSRETQGAEPSFIVCIEHMQIRLRMRAEPHML